MFHIFKKRRVNVELTEVGPNKIRVIKVIREVTGLDLKEAKDIKTKLEAEGAKAAIK